MLPPLIRPEHLTLVSDKDSCNRGMAPMLLGICFGWIMVAAAILISCLAFAHIQYFALSFILPAFIFALFLIANTYNLIRQSNCDYVLEITNHDAAFCKIDRLQRKKTMELVLLSDIKYAEYYPYLDSASIIFHTAYADTEVPLWPMGKHAQDAVDFLVGAGVKVIDVQSDEAIPE